jgi:hypothetical protein
MTATPLSPESHQGFTNMNIGTNTFDDMESDLGESRIPVHSTDAGKQCTGNCLSE